MARRRQERYVVGCYPIPAEQRTEWVVMTERGVTVTFPVRLWWVARGMADRLNAVADILTFARVAGIDELYNDTMQEAINADTSKELLP